MHDKTNTAPVSQGAQKNETLQDRYDSACMRLENNCFVLCIAPDLEELRNENEKLYREIGEIQEEAHRHGIVLLSPKRLL